MSSGGNDKKKHSHADQTGGTRDLTAAGEEAFSGEPVCRESVLQQSGENNASDSLEDDSSCESNGHSEDAAPPIKRAPEASGEHHIDDTESSKREEEIHNDSSREKLPPANDDAHDGEPGGNSGKQLAEDATDGPIAQETSGNPTSPQPGPDRSSVSGKRREKRHERTEKTIQGLISAGRRIDGSYYKSKKFDQSNYFARLLGKGDGYEPRQVVRVILKGFKTTISPKGLISSTVWRERDVVSRLSSLRQQFPDFWREFEAELGPLSFLTKEEAAEVERKRKYTVRREEKQAHRSLETPKPLRPGALALAGSAYRACDIAFALREIKGATPFFAKHQSIDDVRYLLGRGAFEPCPLAICTPSRARQMVEAGLLDLEAVRIVLLDVGFADGKNRTMFEYEDNWENFIALWGEEGLGRVVYLL